MQDRPSALELLDAVRQFIEHQVVPSADGTRKFHARVAANVLTIVARELRDGTEHLRAEWRRLAHLLEVEPHGEPPTDADALRAAVTTLTTELAARVRRGDADAGPFRVALVAHLRATVDEKLRIANPRYLEGAE